MLKRNRLVALCSLVVASIAYGEPRWAIRSVSGPAARYVHGMVYDSCRDVVVLYGGTVDNGGQSFDETWEWNGESWTLRTTSGPGPRRQFAVGFDSNRCKTVLFGGNDDVGNYFRDTWEWDGTAWSQSCTDCPPFSRSGGSMAFDSTLNVMVMFGGWSAGLMNDTWTWDGKTWTAVTTTSPPTPRSFVGMAYDPPRNRIVIFGGNLAGSCSFPPSNQTFELDLSVSPATWTQIATANAPPRRAQSAMAYDVTNDRMILFGGTGGCDQSLNDTWTFDSQASTWIPLTMDGKPAARWGHSFVYDVARSEGLMFGGTSAGPPTGPPRGDTWSFGERAAVIPAASSWGLIVLVLLVLSFGTLALWRARGTSQPV